MKDRNFILALTLAIIQQLFLAASTYSIAMAGSTLTSGNLPLVLQHITFFFIYALLAYLVSSGSSVCLTKASNEIWLKYASKALLEASSNIQLSSEKNKKSLVQWISGESASTISHACSFYLGLVSTCLNVIFTLGVFYLSVGLELTIAISASLAVSFLMIILLKNNISQLAGEIQKKRLEALLSIELTWDSSLFGSKKMKDNSFRQLTSNAAGYFSHMHKYVLMEQVVACLPIVLATLIVTITIHSAGIFSAATAGALVAMLPRSLQVFGNIHSLSIYLSQFFLVTSKLRNLKNFVSGLDRHEGLLKLDLQEITVNNVESPSPIRPADLLSELINGTHKKGRFVIKGRNGSGKSSYLKLIKSKTDDSLLMTPETNFIKPESDRSTGEARLAQISQILVSAPPIVMLDEWDANLDYENIKKIEAVLHEASRRLVVIEARHRSLSQTTQTA